MTVTDTKEYTLAEAMEFARTIRDEPGKVFDFEGVKALRALAEAKERRSFDRIIDVVAENSNHSDILARLEFKCMQADQGYLGARAWNELTALPSPGKTQAYFQKKYGTPYKDMIKARGR